MTGSHKQMKSRAKRAFSFYDDTTEHVTAIKALGQNFLNDPEIAREIASFGNIEPNERVWEIGPGTGILTKELHSMGADITAFELDKRLETELRISFSERFDLRMQDILRVNWPEAIQESLNSIKLISNIPYHITSPLLYLLETHFRHFNRVVLMLQEEVAERICANAGNKAYGLLSLRIQLLFDVKLALRVSREKFTPPPNVDSAVVIFTPRVKLPDIKNPAMFHRIIKAAFSHRRKTLRNNLLSLFNREQLSEIERRSGIDLFRRGETLCEADFITLCDSI